MPDAQTVTLDEIDRFLLRAGTLPEGVICDEEPITETQDDLYDRCEGLTALGYMAFVKKVEYLRHYVTTPLGITAHGAFGNVTNAVN